MINPKEIIIDDNTPIDNPKVTSGCRGLIPKPQNFQSQALDPKDIPLIPMSEWPERIREKEKNKTRLSDIIRQGAAGNPIPAKQQNEGNTGRWGYCWSYAVAGALEALRAVMNQPYVPLSAFGVAYTIKNGRDEGAWGALALDFIMKNGIPSETTWPNFARDRNYQNDPTVWKDAEKYKITSAWTDLNSPVWDRNLTAQQKGSLLLNNIPVVNDYIWWSHAVYSCDLLDLEPHRDPNDPLRYGTRDRNSWGNNYSDLGFFIVKGKRWIPDNAVAPRTTNPS